MPHLTPAEHLAIADVILKTAGKPGGPTMERAEQMAKNRRVLAKLAARRQR
jgi:malate/lactate dehydrogenase